MLIRVIVDNKEIRPWYGLAIKWYLTRSPYMSSGRSRGRMETQVWHLVLIMVIILGMIYHRSNMGIQDELAKLRLRQQFQMYRPAVKRARPVPITTQMPSDNATILSALARPRDVVGVSHGTQATADTEREASLPHLAIRPGKRE